MDLISAKVSETLKELNYISEENSLPTPYLVGGYIRNLYLEEESAEDDLDITTNSKNNSIFLGILYSKKFNCNFKFFERKHISVFHDSKKLDFSSGFISKYIPPNTAEYLMEPMSRDFTIDTIHVSCKDFSIYDFTGRGIEDIKNRYLDTVIDPKFTFFDDPKRIYRALYLASKHNLTISNRVSKAIESINLDDFIVKNIKYVTSIVDKSFDHSYENTIKNIKILNLENKIPMFGEYRNFIINSGKAKEYFSGDLDV